MDIYLETGEKRVFAGALEWPGWCRSGRSEEEALHALLEAGPRYAAAIRPAKLAFSAPKSTQEFNIVERLAGGSTTDFGAPEMAPSRDQEPFDAAEQERSAALLRAVWAALDATAWDAQDKALRKGPRGGGRELDGILRHVLESDGGYLSALGWKMKKSSAATLQEALEATRQAVLEALAASVRGEIPERGPRGGLRWRPRYFVRRLAWHALDHLWEIEDRAEEGSQAIGD
jgi:hypothetical protein